MIWRSPSTSSKPAGGTPLRVVWLTPAAAASSRWAILKAHKAFSKPWLAALKVEGQAVRAALEGTEISEVAAEGKRESAPRG